MPEITNQTLIIAIQAVASEIRALREAIASGDAAVDEHQILDDHLKAAEDLERAHGIAAQTVRNLPPYHDLVGD